MSGSDGDGQIVSDQPQDKESQESVREAEAKNIEYYTVSETNPRFDIIISHSHINHPYYLRIPARITSMLPGEKVSVVLKLEGKSWSTFYNGHNRAKVLEMKGWRKFGEDNELKVGDCCVFELMEASRKGIEFKVILLKTDSSFQFMKSGTAEAPITL